MTFAAVIVAAGRGVRMGGTMPKQYRLLAGRPVLSHSLDQLASHPDIEQVVVAIHPDDREYFNQAVSSCVADHSKIRAVSGGDSRQQSVLRGLESFSGVEPDGILIHDGARPFADHDLMDRLIAALAASSGAIAALQVVDTLKKSAPGNDGDFYISSTVDREGLWRAQTPQAFDFGKILDAHRAAAGLSLTDDAAIAENAGIDVLLVAGSEKNFKITTNEDLQRAEFMLAGTNSPESRTAEYRTGQGFDVHAFGDGDHVTLCGVDIPHKQGLAGHSDADVALHALTDAILGTIGEADIGQHFPPGDPDTKGADSAVFLSHAVKLLSEKGGVVRHIDLTIICEAPKIGPHRPAMREQLAALLKLSLDRVSVKATTTEKLGFTGRREGIAALAVATVSLSETPDTP